MIRVKRIDHVAIAVADRDASATALRKIFALAPGARESVASQQTDVAFLNTDAGADDAALEVIAPAGNATLEKFLTRRGPGLHHICFLVDDLDAELRRLAADGYELIDQAPRPGHAGRVAFLHPRQFHDAAVLAHGVADTLIALLILHLHLANVVGNADVIGNEYDERVRIGILAVFLYRRRPAPSRAKA